MSIGKMAVDHAVHVACAGDIEVETAGTGGAGRFGCIQNVAAFVRAVWCRYTGLGIVSDAATTAADLAVFFLPMVVLPAFLLKKNNRATPADLRAHFADFPASPLEDGADNKTSL